MRRNVNATLEYMQAQLVSAVLRSDSIQNIVDLSRRMAETAGIVAGTMIARRVKDCCDTCASAEGVAVTINDMVATFKAKLEEAARATAATIKADEVAVYKGILMHDNPPKDELPAEPSRRWIDFVVDAHNHFVEVEDQDGKSFLAGAWLQREGGMAALRVYPEVFGPRAPKADEKPEPTVLDGNQRMAMDPISEALRRQFKALLLDSDLHVVQVRSPIEAILMLAGERVSPETLAKLEAAAAHHKSCRCEDCLMWWAYAGPDQVPGDYGPFTKDEVNTKQKGLGVEETP